MTVDYRIRAERPEDAAAIDRLHAAAFEGDALIAPLVARLRQLEAPLPTLSLLAEAAGGQVIGHVMLSHGWLDAPDRLRDVWVLSPLGVAPEMQRQGIGSALLARAVAAAGEAPGAAPLLFLEGNPAFYRPRGFAPAKTLGLRSPSLRIPEKALQVACLPGYSPELTGTLVYRDLWWELDCVGLR